MFAFCVGGDSKLVGHLLLPCLWHKLCGIDLYKPLGYYGFLPGRFEDFVHARKAFHLPAKSGCSGKVGHTIARTIWLERNRMIFKDVIADLDNL